MADMKFKENVGVDPVTLSKGYTALESDPPNSGESVTAPRHVTERKRMEALYAENPWPDMQPDDDGPEGFVERVKPSPFDRPSRTEDEDRG